MRVFSLAVFCLLFMGNVKAHDRFILPSHTVLSGDEGSVSFISSVSNDIFHADRPFGDNGSGVVPPSLKGFFAALSPVVIDPDGKVATENIWQAFSRFSAADLAMKQSGTYRVGLVHPDHLMITFRKKDGSRGRGRTEADIPEGATDIVRWMSSSRVETFVTLNSPNNKAVAPTGVGLELGGATHPNDLFVGEQAQFQLFYNGKPLDKAASVTAGRGGTRHRNQRAPQNLETTEDGAFNITFDPAGFYLIQAEFSFPGESGSGVDKRSASLFLTVEVFPE